MLVAQKEVHRRASRPRGVRRAAQRRARRASRRERRRAVPTAATAAAAERRQRAAAKPGKNLPSRRKHPRSDFAHNRVAIIRQAEWPKGSYISIVTPLKRTTMTRPMFFQIVQILWKTDQMSSAFDSMFSHQRRSIQEEGN